jgi:molybdopterin synthase catalytic subunit
MKALAVTGPPDERTALLDRLVDCLSERGRVGTIRADSEVDTDQTDVAQTYTLWADGWTASGDSLSLSSALDRLAQDCTYAIIEGATDARLPTVVLGEDREDVLLTAETADAVDMDTLVDRLESTESYETLSSLVERVKHSSEEDRAGAIATFTGRVRAKDAPDDDPTEYLEFEKYDGVAQEKMDALREDLEAREGVYEVRLHHRTGVVEAGEDIVFVVVLAGHRTEAFQTVEDGINRLKEEVPLFKKEVTVSEEFWAHER